MKITYCQSCGAKNQYEYQRPNFCISCGSKFATATVAAPPKPVKKQVRIVKDEDEEEEEEYEDSDIDFLNIKPLKAEIFVGSAPIYNIDQLKKMPSPMIDDSPRAPTNPRKIKESFEELKSRVSSVRNVDIE